MPNDLQVMEGTIDAEVLADLTVRREPSIVLEEARKAAVCLKDVLDKKPNKFMIGKEQYLEFEDWQTVGKFYGVTCGQDDDPQHAPKVDYVEFGGVKGFKATCVALHNGKVISRASAFCLTDEEKWGERNKYEWVYCLKSGGTSVENPPKHEIMWIPNPNQEGKFLPKKERVLLGKENVPLFQLASMAQTRANAKVLRNVLSWVVVLAGYKPTPAEEMTTGKQVEQHVEQDDVVAPPPPPPHKPLPTGAEMEAKMEAKSGPVDEYPRNKESVHEPAVEEVMEDLEKAAALSMPTPGNPPSIYTFTDKLDNAESIKEWSDVMNEAQRFDWNAEQRTRLDEHAQRAKKRLTTKGKK